LTADLNWFSEISGSHYTNLTKINLVLIKLICIQIDLVVIMKLLYTRSLNLQTNP